MIHLVEPSAYAHYGGYFDEMYRQRARLFSGKLKWEVAVDAQGREIDELDALGPKYLMSICPETGRLKGTMRLLPTSGPTLLSSAFGETVPHGTSFSSDKIWECSRLCVEDYTVENRARLSGGLQASLELMVGMGEVGIKYGWTGIIANFEPTLLKIFQRSGCEAEVLSQMELYGTTVALGMFPVCADILANMKRRWGIAGDVLTSEAPRTDDCTQGDYPQKAQTAVA